jgi:urease subunit alpha
LITPGKIADLVLWPRASFGVKPWLVLKRGFIAWAAMGDANGSLSLSEPIIHRPMWGALGAAPGELGLNFFSKLAVDADLRGKGLWRKMALRKQAVQIKNTRSLGKADMIRNSALPHIEVDPQTFEVRADGRLLTCPPAAVVPLFRKYMLR